MNWNILTTLGKDEYKIVVDYSHYFPYQNYLLKRKKHWWIFTYWSTVAKFFCATETWRCDDEEIATVIDYLGYTVHLTPIWRN